MTDSQEKDYRCPTCGSEFVSTVEFNDDEGTRRVHIYCLEPDCEWIHRSLAVNGGIVNNA